MVSSVKGLLQINEDNAIKKTSINIDTPAIFVCNKAVGVPCSERSLTVALDPNKKIKFSFVSPVHI